MQRKGITDARFLVALAKNKHIEYKVDGETWVYITMNSSGKCLVFGIPDNDSEEKQEFLLKAASMSLNFKQKLRGFSAVRIKTTEVGSAQVGINSLEFEEPRDDKDPPEPVRANGILGQMRQAMRQQMGFTREDFAEGDLPSIHEIDESNIMFEEEENALRKAEAEARQQIDIEEAIEESKNVEVDKPIEKSEGEGTPETEH